MIHETEKLWINMFLFKHDENNPTSYYFVKLSRQIFDYNSHTLIKYLNGINRKLTKTVRINNIQISTIIKRALK